MTFHLWCSSNSLMDDSVCLRLFHWTLSGTTAKWYIELLQDSFMDFGSVCARNCFQGQRNKPTQSLVASHSGKVTIGYSNIRWEARRRSKEPCYDIPFLVFFQLPHGWLHSVTTLSMNFDRYGHEVVHWTPTTFICGFWLIGNHVSYTLSAPYSLWNGY